jgi:hypothetical protein
VILPRISENATPFPCVADCPGWADAGGLPTRTMAGSSHPAIFHVVFVMQMRPDSFERYAIYDLQSMQTAGQTIRRLIRFRNIRYIILIACRPTPLNVAIAPHIQPEHPAWL